MNMGDKSDGIQLALGNAIVNNFAGAQIGAYNDYKDSNGFQFGLINRVTNSKAYRSVLST